MTATSLSTARPPRTAGRWYVGIWAVVSGLVGAFVAALVLLMLDVRDTGAVIGAVVGGVISAFAAFPLAARPRLRIGMLAGFVMVAAAWAAAFYLDIAHVHEESDGTDHALPWHVSQLTDWQALAVPVGLGFCVALAMSAVVLVQRRTLVHAGRWTAGLGAALVLCLLVRALMEATRIYLN